MPISMQGTWYVRVKSKSASFAQRYIISGATSGNGTYNGVTSTPEVLVTGNDWNISIQHDPGSGFVNSTMKIKFPQVIGGEYKFDLESNDSGGDQDFNDLILTFRTPVTDQDYIVYGNVSCYKGCLFNLCSPFLVLDTWLKFKEALKNKSILEAVQQYYPSLADEALRSIEHEPPPEPFRPVVVPLSGDRPIPEKEEIITIAKPAEIAQKGSKKSAKNSVVYSYNALRTAETRLARQSITNAEISGVNRAIFREAAKILDRVRLFCEKKPLPHALLKFEEYDRSTAELSGSPYTGEGPRESLGDLTTDFLGNYIFRFKRATADILQEVDVDVAPGETASVQSRPDLIVQLKDQFEPNVSLFETAPYWNIPFLKRINICIPKEKCGLIPNPCHGQHILQGIGNVALAEENASGNRVGFNNYLNNLGLITAFDSLAPSVRCAAWNGHLKLRGCLKNPQIKYYTLEYRKVFGPWLPFNQELRLPRFIGSLKISAIVNRTFGPAASPIDGYLNVETDSGLWLEAFKNIKANIKTSAFDDGRYFFRIQGYRANGNQFPGSEETIRLYFQKSTTTVRVDPNVSLGGATLGNCALFTLPVDGSGNIIQDAPMTIRFKVEHNPLGGASGFINQYALSMSKGATGGFALNVPVVDANFVAPGQLDTVVNRGRRYVHIDNLSCNTSFKGTVNEVSADPSGFYTVTVQPVSGGWLESDQNFCAFSINLGGTLRLTDGSSGYPDFNATRVLIGIEKPELST
ncbi:hypothetical protein QQ008_13990 [Fulvivirgaceae bacterium BMA10]|uniref:Uncharacterized protein n=1 Tax=Splendidivirga corallicola TaxID=3051826 RepID=A0ABT8KQP7_9BACT|nr:hypothetical protein [Fulvivirgaceae bacterium BMA10]